MSDVSYQRRKREARTARRRVPNNCCLWQKASRQPSYSRKTAVTVGSVGLSVSGFIFLCHGIGITILCMTSLIDVITARRYAVYAVVVCHKPVAQLLVSPPGRHRNSAGGGLMFYWRFPFFLLMSPLSFDSGLTDHNADYCVNTVDEKNTTAKNSVNFGQGTLLWQISSFLTSYSKNI